MAHLLKILLVATALQLASLSAFAANDQNSKQKQSKILKKKNIKKTKSANKLKAKNVKGHRKNSLKKGRNIPKKATLKKAVNRKTKSKMIRKSAINRGMKKAPALSKKKQPTKKKVAKKSGGLRAKKLSKSMPAKSKETSSNSKWYLLAFSLCVFGGAGILVYRNEAKRKMAFNFKESDVNRSANSKARTLLKFQPSSKIISSQIVAKNQSHIQNIGLTTISPLRDISCELNFNNPIQDHGQPKKKFKHSA